ncbi:MAG: chemotaxis protein CheW [Deltaproteobacteria bacterium]|jgi:chemotaxis signal transduction protein|nr:chemotaxis protein CheW [Deltaproteobacteria bacterium]MBW2475905.1 chemotaxis protein CheW [Deltaproteobacteria bacterium]
MNWVLLFQLDDLTYGIKVESVQEIVEKPEQYPLPGAKGCLRSVINFHGEVLAVINLPKLCRCKASHLDTRLIVLTDEFHSLAVQVNSVGSVVEIDIDRVASPGPGSGPPVLGTCQHDDEGDIHLFDMGSVIRQLEKLDLGVDGG